MKCNSKSNQTSHSFKSHYRFSYVYRNTINKSCDNCIIQYFVYYFNISKKIKTESTELSFDITAVKMKTNNLKSA